MEEQREDRKFEIVNRSALKGMHFSFICVTEKKVYFHLYIVFCSS